MQLSILVISFNRPDLLSSALHSILTNYPTKVYLFNDGPRNPEDALAINKIKDIVTAFDKSLEIEAHFSPFNLGAKRNIEQALNYFFSTEEFGIILEDDCIPNTNFYKFVEAEWARIRNTTQRDFPIAGTRFRFLLNSKSRVISRMPHIWGWACTRDYWMLYPKDQKALDNVYNRFISSRFRTFPGEKSFFIKYRERFGSNQFGYVDYILYMVNRLYDKKFILPTYSLVNNSGFDNRATNTYASRLQNLIAKTTMNSNFDYDKNSTLRSSFVSLQYDFKNFVFCQLMCETWPEYLKYQFNQMVVSIKQSYKSKI